MPRMLGHACANIFNLLGKLARWRHHEHERPATASTPTALAAGSHMTQAAHGRKQERRSFARARLCSGKEIAASEHLGNCRSLHRGGLGIAEIAHGGEHLVRKAEAIEAEGLGCVT